MKDQKRQRIADEIYDLGPRHDLSPDAKEQLDAEVKRVAKPLLKANGLAKFSRGRLHFDIPLIWLATIVADLQKSREVAHLLRISALQLSFAGKAPEACKAALAICHAGRFIGQPDTMIAQLVRIAVMTDAVATAEQALSRGQADKETLPALQHWFELEDKDTAPMMLHAARFERAMTHRMMEALWDGRVTFTQLESQTVKPAPDSWWRQFTVHFGMASFRAEQSDFLRETTNEIERWKQPWGPVQIEKTSGLDVHPDDSKKWSEPRPSCAAPPWPWPPSVSAWITARGPRR
jgi:hypothetical protein